MCLKDIPEDRMARISFLDARSPRTMDAAVNEENGKVYSSICGIARDTSNIIEPKSTCFNRIFWANSNNWLIKKMKKKNKNATRNESKNSRRT